MSDKKYSIGEVVVMGFISPFFITLIMVLTIPIALFEAWIRTTLWNWFIAPYFHLNPIRMSVMFMVGYIVALFYPNIPKNKEEKWWTALLGVILMHIIALGFGYLIHQRF